MSAEEAARIRLPEQEAELSRQWLAQAHRQVRPARPAAAVVLVRDGREGVEVLLRHRAGRTPLGTVGFPGGSVLESDADACPWYGPEPAVWAHVLGMPDRRRVRQRIVAAVRELFEESGVLLAGRSPSDVVSDARGESWGAHRSSLEAGESSLPRLLAERGLGLRTDLLRALGRFHSAPHSPRRFDTVLFAAALPPMQETAPKPEALTHQAWLPVAGLLTEPMPLPGPEGWLGPTGRRMMTEVSAPMTEVVLRRIATHRSAAGFLAALGQAGSAAPEYRFRTEADVDGTGAVWCVVDPVPRPPDPVPRPPDRGPRA